MVRLIFFFMVSLRLKFLNDVDRKRGKMQAGKGWVALFPGLGQIISFDFFPCFMADVEESTSLVMSSRASRASIEAPFQSATRYVAALMHWRLYRASMPPLECGRTA